MRRDLIRHCLNVVLEVWLTILVHFDALRAEPRAYLTAAKWWILRKRVRARGKLAPLLSQSPRAYLLWALREDRQGKVHSPPDFENPIIALIDTGGESDPNVVAITLQSLADEHIETLIIGAEETPDLASAAQQIDWSRAPWLMPVAAGDKIAPGAAETYRQAARDAKVRLIYADDDGLDGRLRRRPYFKPDWNAELFAHHDYLTGACIVRATEADLVAVAHAPDWAPQLIKRATSFGMPLHLGKLMHHRLRRPSPRCPAAPLEVARDLPAISVIVPTRNHVELLRTCLEGLGKTEYPDLEVIVVDNDSDDFNTLNYLAGLNPLLYRVLHHPGAFNYSAINNRAVDIARGQLICLLNNDIEVTGPDWLAILATQAMRPEVGAVGARLYYPDGRIQHAGVVIGVGNAAGHAHRFLRAGDEGYFHRHNLPQFTMAVTAACLVVERDKFLAVGGLDEREFPVAFNDVDLCLRLNQRGWQSLYEPRATLVHHESVSRGFDKDEIGAARFARELAALKRVWKTDKIVDPYHHPQLSRASEQFAVAL